MTAANDRILAKSLMTALTAAIDELIGQLDSDDELGFIGYETSPVLKIDEAATLAHGQQSITVTPLSQWHDRWTVLHYYKRFYVADGCSTRFVSRMAGFLSSNKNPAVIMALVDQVNDLKDQLKAVVQNNRNHQQRHKFIHDVFPQVMTEQLYRHIGYSQRQIKSAWFRWRSRQVNKTYTTAQAISWLAEQKTKTKNPFTPDEWQAAIEAAIAKIDRGGFRHIQQLKTYRDFPICEYSYYANDVRKMARLNATTPLILVNQHNNRLPSGTGLLSFTKDGNASDCKPCGLTESVFKPLKIIGVY